MEKGKIAWALTGAGHLLQETVDAMTGFTDTDIYGSEAAEEVLAIYKVQLPERPIKNRSASGTACIKFFTGDYRLLVVAPATSNSVAKFVYGISDSLVSTLFAQAGKARIPIIVLPCDLEEEMTSSGPTTPVKVYPRPIDLENLEKLKNFPGVTVVESPEELKAEVAKQTL